MFPLKLLRRLSDPTRLLLRRVGSMLLFLTAIGLMVLGKVDILLIDRARVMTVDVMAPILDAMSRPAAIIGDYIEALRHWHRLHEENQRLLAENEHLRHWQQVALTLERRNDQLVRLLNFHPDPQARFLTSRIIADPGSAFVRSLLVATGYTDGVRKGQAAVTGRGLVGRVSEVGQFYARILMITDLNSRVPVLVEATRDRAILIGDNSHQPRLGYLLPGAQVQLNDRIVTSGHGGVLPPGIPVGNVVSIDGHEVRIKTLVDWDRLEYIRLVDFKIKGILNGNSISTNLR